MTYSRKFLFALLILGILCSCTQTPEQRAKDATVLMVIGNADGTVSNGSGFFVESDKIATNIHVVDSARMVFAVGTKKVYNIECVTGYAPEHDLVILKVSGKGKPFELGEGKIDEPIFVVGYPGGGYDVTKGIVHGIRESDKQLRLVAEGFREKRGDSPLDGGNSGGPILNSKWKVIGIAASGHKRFSYASTSSELKTLLNSVKEENFSDWQKRKPIRAFAYRSYGDEKLRGGDYKLAMEVLDEAMKLYQYAEAYNDQGHTKENLGLHQEAIQDYTKAIRLIPDDAVAYYNRGNAKRQIGNYDGAIQDYNKILELNPDYADAYLERGLAKVSMSEPDHVGAIQDYTEGINRHPKDPWNYYSNRGTAKIAKPVPDYAGAIEDYTKAIQLEEDFVVAYRSRGLARQKIDDHNGAIENYTKAISLSSKNTDLKWAHFGRGDAKKSLGQDGDAKLDHAKAHYYEGKANSNNGQYQAAVKSFDESIGLNPDYAEAYYARGNAKILGSNYQAAISDYTQAIYLNPDYAEAYYARGNAKVKLGIDYYQEAVQDYANATNLKPKFAEAHYNLGLMQYRLGEHKVAIDHFRTAIKLKNELKEPVIYAKAYKARGEAKKASGEDEDAKEDLATAYYHWGREAYNDRKYEKAIKNFDTIIPEPELDPDIVYVYHVDFYDARGAAKRVLGESKADLGGLESALKLYQEAIEDHDNAIKLVELLSDNELTDQAAIKDIDKAIKLNEVKAQYYRNRGETKFLRGAIRDYNDAVEDYKEAIEDFTVAIKGKSDLVDTYNLRGTARCLLGYVKANHGHSKEARKHYKLALKDFEKAIDLVKKAIDSASDEVEIIRLKSDKASYYQGLGLANAALGKAKAAIDAFEKAKQPEPESGK